MNDEELEKYFEKIGKIFAPKILYDTKEQMGKLKEILGEIEKETRKTMVREMLDDYKKAYVLDPEYSYCSECGERIEMCDNEMDVNRDFEVEQEIYCYKNGKHYCKTCHELKLKKLKEAKDDEL